MIRSWPAVVALGGLLLADDFSSQLDALQHQNMDRVYQERRDQEAQRLDQSRSIPRTDQSLHDTDRALDRLHDFPPADRPAAEVGADAQLQTLHNDADRAERKRERER